MFVIGAAGTKLFSLYIFGLSKFQNDSNYFAKISRNDHFKMLMIDSWYDKTPTTDTSQNRESAAKNNLKAYIGSLIKSVCTEVYLYQYIKQTL